MPYRLCEQQLMEQPVKQLQVVWKENNALYKYSNNDKKYQINFSNNIKKNPSKCKSMCT